MKRRLDYLDSVRALAAMAVAFFHFAMGLEPTSSGLQQKILYAVTGGIDIGKVGVVTFFMVSGFVIPISLKFDRPKRVALQDFLIGRVFRLYPAYWLSMVLIFFVGFGGSLALCPPKRILLNLTMFQQFFGGTAINMMGLYWTLQIEWIFYILCIGLFLSGWLTKPKRLLQTQLVSLAAALLMAVVRFKTHHNLPIAAPLGLCVMLCASLWRMVVFEHRAEAVPSMRLAFASFLLTIPIISRLAYTDGWIRYTLVYWLAIAAFRLLTTHVKLNWRPLAIIGRASFSLYLLNNFVRTLLIHIAPPERVAPHLPVAYILASVLISSVVAIPVYEYFENPFIRLGKTLARKLHQPEPSAVDKTATQYV